MADCKVFSKELLLQIGLNGWGNEATRRMLSASSYSDMPDMVMIMNLWTFRWVEEGANRVVVDDRLAALLMSTDMGGEMLNLAKPPWGTFLVEFPAGLLTAKVADTGTPVSIQRVHVDIHDDTWTLVISSSSSEGPAVQILVGLTSDTALQTGAAIQSGESDFVSDDLRSEDQRIIAMIARFLPSLFLHLSSPENLREQKSTKGRTGGKSRFGKGPRVHTFIAGSQVKVDCRKAIRDFCSGVNTGKHISVQSLVRGHWKRQAHGPNMSLRKVIHIEPYWKGPEDAKILFRPVKVGTHNA